MRKLYTIFHRHTADRNKRQHIRGTQSWVLALMFPHVDQLRGARDHSDRGAYNLFRRSDKSNNRTIVVRVDMLIQHAGRCHCFNRAPQRLDSCSLATFAEVWYTLHQGIADFRLPWFALAVSLTFGPTIR